jgi:hypothetical protein
MVGIAPTSAPLMTARMPNGARRAHQMAGPLATGAEREAVQYAVSVAGKKVGGDRQLIAWGMADSSGDRNVRLRPYQNDHAKLQEPG